MISMDKIFSCDNRLWIRIWIEKLKVAASILNNDLNIWIIPFNYKWKSQQ